MNVSTAIQTRRSIKAFDPEHRMSDVEITHLMSLALLSPTAFNIQNWRFVLVSDSELRRQLRAVAWDQAQVTDASLLIILAADIKAWQKEPSRYWKNVPQTIREFLLPVIDQYYRGREQAQRDEAMRSCGMAAMTLMLAAEEMGYASCPMDGFDFDAVAKLIHLPEDYVISMFVAIGKGIKEPWPRGGQLPLEEVIIHNKF
jgi:nitroreductase